MLCKRLCIMLLALTAVVAANGQKSFESAHGGTTVPQGPRNDVKFTLLSFGSGSMRVTYERAIGLRNSAELTVGLIGVGYDMMNEAYAEGLLLKAAYKWNLIPMKGVGTPLAGFYVKPELVYADFDYLFEQNDMHTRQMALLAECGYQLVMSWFVFDIYAGLGPTVGTGNRHNYYHSFMRFPPDGPLAYTAGFRLGFAF